MKDKNMTPFLILGAFVLGFAFYGLMSTASKPMTNSANIDNESDSEVVTKEADKASDKVTTEEADAPNIARGKSLNLSGQGLDKLPSYVLSRTDLEELNISDNQLTGALPSEIGKLTRLKVLNASNNSMTGVPAEIGHLPALEVLDLSNNQLTGLPNELAQLDKLKVLNLSGNDYSEQDLDVIRRGLSPDVNIIL